MTDSLESFDVGVVDYLVKPIRYDRFLRAVNRALARQPGFQPPAPQPAVATVIHLKQGYESVPVLTDDIAYIEACGAYCKVYFSDKKPLLVNHLLAELIDKLPADQFRRVHRSFVVAIAKIKTFSNRQLTIGQQRIPVGRAYHNQLPGFISPS